MPRLGSSITYWYQAPFFNETIVFALKFVAGRLEKEVLGLLPPSMTSGIRVLPPPYGTDSAWFGALSIGNLSTFPTS